VTPVAARGGPPHIRGVARLLPLGLVLAALACTHTRELVPAPGAQTAPGRPRVAEEAVEGVHVQVDSGAWTSSPVREILSPVRVTIEDGSARALRISYGQFTLGGPSGFRLAALPPYQVVANDVAATAATVPPGFVGQNFFLAPGAAHVYRGVAPWYGPFPYDPVYYNRWYGAWPTNLPNDEVLRHALPEGVLQPGGKLSGFLYFPEQAPGTGLSFYFSHVDANTGSAFGTIAIPFTVK
jgi:hypothetical protein